MYRCTQWVYEKFEKIKNCSRDRRNRDHWPVGPTPSPRATGHPVTPDAPSGSVIQRVKCAQWVSESMAIKVNPLGFSGVSMLAR
jgi:hypothetical protein